MNRRALFKGLGAILTARAVAPAAVLIPGAAARLAPLGAGVVEAAFAETSSVSIEAYEALRLAYHAVAPVGEWTQAS